MCAPSLCLPLLALLQVDECHVLPLPLPANRESYTFEGLRTRPSAGHQWYQSRLVKGSALRP